MICVTKKKSKTFIVIAVVAVLLILLVPVRFVLKDGGSKVYRAVTYEVTRYNRICEALGEDGLPTSIRLRGWRIKILGFTLYDDDELLREEYDKHGIEMLEYYALIDAAN